MLITNVQGLKSLDLKSDVFDFQLNLIKEISKHISSIKKLVNEMTILRDKAESADTAKKKAVIFNDKLKPLFDKIRSNVDALEMMVDDEEWPLPKYREMILLR